MCGLLLQCTKTHNILWHLQSRYGHGRDQTHEFPGTLVPATLKPSKEKNILWAQAEPRKVGGLKDAQIDLQRKFQHALSVRPWTMKCTWFALLIKYDSEKTIMYTLFKNIYHTAGDPKQQFWYSLAQTPFSHFVLEKVKVWCHICKIHFTVF